MHVEDYKSVTVLQSLPNMHLSPLYSANTDRTHIKMGCPFDSGGIFAGSLKILNIIE